MGEYILISFIGNKDKYAIYKSNLIKLQSNLNFIYICNYNVTKMNNRIKEIY